MVQFLGVVWLMCHCATVHSVVAVSTAANGLWELSSDAYPIVEHDLEPETQPADIADC